MKKIDILSFITDHRKAPNDIKTHSQIVAAFGDQHAPELAKLLQELQQARVIREVDSKGEKSYQVIAR